MPKGYTMTWNGDDITERLLRAAAAGIDDTMSDCVIEAKSNTPVVTATLQGSITVHEPATIRGGKVAGIWGSRRVHYALYVEVGTRRSRARRMMRNAADKHYPQLRANMARHI